MSFSSQNVALLLDPLVGKTTVFLLEDRSSNLDLANAILPTLARGKEGCSILDLDAFYSSNIDVIGSRMPAGRMERVELRVPEAGANIERVLADLFLDASIKPLIIDSANTLHQLLASQNPRPSSRKFAFLAAAMSSWARANAGMVLSSTYERGTATHKRSTRSLYETFDVVISVSRKARGLAMRCERGNAWRERDFFLPLENG